MITKTTVKGYTIVRMAPLAGELERWAVDKNRLHYGWIVKAKYQREKGGNPLVFWYCILEKQYGHRRFIHRKVDDTRRGAILKLAQMVER